MKKLLIMIGVVALISALFYRLNAQEGFKTLDSIKVDGDSIVMSLSGKTKHHVFKISNPPRLVVEFSNTEHNVKNKEMEVNGTLIKRIRSGQFENEPVKIARIVIDLAKMTEYSLKDNGNNVILVLNSGDAATAAAVTPAEPVEAKVETPAKAEPAVAPKTSEEIPTVIATPFDGKTLDPEPQAVPEKKEPSPAAVKAKAPVAEIAKPVPVEAKKTEFRSSGKVNLPKKPITLDFEEAEITDVLRVLSIKSGINIIHGNEVSGTITLHLENVPFDKAFETILSLKGLVSQEQGPNILRITTPQTITEERSRAVTFTKIFSLNYATADDVKANLDAIRQAEGRRGNISVDARTNSLIVTDTPEGLSSLESILSELDKKPQQVIIEAKIVEINVTNTLDLGIQWQYAGQVSNNPNIAVGQTVASVGDSGFGVTQAGSDLVSPVSPGAGGTGVSFPAAAASGQTAQIAFGIWGNGRYLTGVLNALAQKGLSKILSTPKVTTINNKEARILVGQRIPYTTTTVTTAGSTQATQFLEVGIKLTVTPTINVDEKITLKVHPEVSLYVRADAAGPVTGTREAETTVMVNNGETVVIGGLITENDQKLGTQVPLLGDLPIIGHLFKRDYHTKERTELLVFLTPQIINN
jgi:type IV pilus assembly protein PilQ